VAVLSPLRPTNHLEEHRVDAPAPYFHWGFILISLPNLVLIGVMVLLFIVALIAPFPAHGTNEEERHDQ
jgi:hypothetical protein